eukprot:165460_1
MAQEANDKQLKGKYVYILIRGCTNPPKSINVSKRKGTKNGGYLAGMTLDMANMEKFVTGPKGKFKHLYNTVSDMVSLECDYVLGAIKKAAEYTKENGASGLIIYYTGHGEEDTGNWCFSDGVITLDQVVNVVSKYCHIFEMFCDCCFSGNWAEELSEYANELKCVKVYAACFPEEVAYDDPDEGGYFTRWLVNKNLKGWAKDKWFPDKFKNRCIGNIHHYRPKGEKYKIEYFCGANKLKIEYK